MMTKRPLTDLWSDLQVMTGLVKKEGEGATPILKSKEDLFYVILFKTVLLVLLRNSS